MSETENQPITQTATAPTTEQQPPKPVVMASSLPEDALKARLDSAKTTGRNELLRELGVTDPAQLKSALDAIKAADEARKSDAQKYAELAASEQSSRARLAEYEQAIVSVRDAEIAKLTPEQLNAVNALAGDNPAAQVRAINALRPTWATATTVQQSAPVATQSAAPTVPTSTAPLPNAPPSQTISPEDCKGTYAALLKINPIQAARYLVAHEREFINQ